MAWTYQGKAIKEGSSWKDQNGVMHPQNWAIWSNETKISKGLVWVDDPASYDNRFYFSSGSPRDLDELKAEAIKVTKDTAGTLIGVTDWKVIKASEVSDYSVDQATLDYRAAVRTASNTIETAINDAADHDAFIALYNAPVDSDGAPTGNAPINDWPDDI